MKKFTLAAVAALAVSAMPAFAADMPVKAARMVAPPPPPAWDLAFGSAIASDYVWRGITQSNHKPSVAAYFEPRYNINKDLQLYVGIGGGEHLVPEPRRGRGRLLRRYPADLRQALVRLRRLVLLVPGRPVLQQRPCRADGCAANGSLPVNGNVAKTDLSFYEIYGKMNYAVTDAFGLGAFVYYSPNVLNTGADGIFFGGNAKYTFAGVRPPASRRTSPAKSATGISARAMRSTAQHRTSFPNGIPYASYATWNLGIGWTWKVFTLDLRYTDTDLSKGDCNAFTSDHTAVSDRRRHRDQSGRLRLQLVRRALHRPACRPTSRSTPT